MDSNQLTSLFNSLTPAQQSEYMKRIAVAYEPEISPQVKELFQQLAADHEIQMITDGTPENCYAIGIGDSETVHMDDDAKARLQEIYVEMRANSSKPIYLIHNHPYLDPSVADTIPSPSDIYFFSRLPSGLIPAIYPNRTDTVLAYPFDTN